MEELHRAGVGYKGNKTKAKGRHAEILEEGGMGQTLG